MSTRTTRTSTAHIISETQMQEHLSHYVAAHCAIEEIESRVAKQIELIKAEAAKEIEPHKAAKTLHESMVKAWALSNSERFSKLRKIEVYGGHKIGFQLGQPTVKPCRPAGGKGRQTFKDVLEACKRIGGLALSFIRTVEDVDKEAILAHGRLIDTIKTPAARAEAEAIFSQVGVKIEQEERFVIDLNLQPKSEG